MGSTLRAPGPATAHASRRGVSASSLGDLAASRGGRCGHPLVTHYAGDRPISELPLAATSGREGGHLTDPTSLGSPPHTNIGPAWHPDHLYRASQLGGHVDGAGSVVLYLVAQFVAKRRPTT